MIDEQKKKKKKKSKPRSANVVELGCFEIGCNFEKNNFEIYESNFQDFWGKINFETFMRRTVPKRCVPGVF